MFIHRSPQIIPNTFDTCGCLLCLTYVFLLTRWRGSGMDQRGKQRIKRELLKRLTSCGSILHIGLDSVGNKVGA